MLSHRPRCVRLVDADASLEEVDPDALERLNAATFDGLRHLLKGRFGPFAADFVHDALEFVANLAEIEKMSKISCIGRGPCRAGRAQAP